MQNISSNLRMWWRLRKDGVPLGTDVNDGSAVYLNSAHLARHLHVLGPPGAGKTRFLFWLFQVLCFWPEATLIMVNPKGSLCRMARDWMIERGIAKDRLLWFDPGDEHGVLGYDPLKPNGLGVHTHAKAVRESFRASRAQASFDETPRLAHYLFLSLALARTFEWGLVEALQLLRPHARLRREILPRIQDQFLRESLASFDALNQNLQLERAESTITRLESFVCDETIRRIFTHRPAFDIGQVIDRRRVLLINTEIGRPLCEDDTKLMLRFIVNDVVSHVRRRQPDDASPVFLIGDEVQIWGTRDLCSALDQGRELKLWCTLAHQRLGQLQGEETSGDLYDAIRGCARTKVLFGGLSVEDLKILVPDVKIDQYSPLIVKDEVTSLEIEPIESTREVVTRGHTAGGSLAVNEGMSSATARAEAHGISRQWGASNSHSDAYSLLHSSGVSSGISEGETLLPNGETILISHDISGTSEVDASSTTTSDTYGEFQAEGEQNTSSVSEAQGRQTTFGATVNHSRNESRSMVPFVEQHVRRVVSSRTFLTPEEIDRLDIREIKAQPDMHFLVKTPTHPAVFCKAPPVPDPKLLAMTRSAVMAEIFAQSIYAKPEPTMLTAGKPYQLSASALEFSEPPPNTFREEK